MRLTVPPSLGYGDQGIRKHIEAGEEEFINTGASLEGEFSSEGSLDNEVPPSSVSLEYKVPPGASLEYEVSVLSVEDGEADKAGFLQL